MIDNYLLEELVTFAQTGTLAKTAEQLMITQPTVTRGMQKLEDELGVKLFIRQPNRIRLSKTGQLAATEAAKVLAANDNFVTKVKNFAASQRVIQIAAVAPGPLMIADQLSKDLSLEINRPFVKPAEVVSTLTNHAATIVFTNQEILTDTVESLFMGSEKLFVNLDQFMFLANKQSVHFADLKGFSFVVDNQIGVWKQVIDQKIPDAKFLYQTQRNAMREITKYSNFPYFSTDITQHIDRPTSDDDDDRVCIPIDDDEATMDFYASYLKRRKKDLRSVLQQFSTQWSRNTK